ncbi:TrkH family potassium uptake protein [Bernardetia sp. OM2101]|uniref:TrkH family potassium uptake protein n=1 Tax=Bernardetia sp. OM2101 TaxID=3344876 RepID=UPI0035CEF7F8
MKNFKTRFSTYRNTFRERFQNHVFESRDRILLLIKTLSVICSAIALGFLVYRYGFHVDAPIERVIFGTLDIIFFAFAIFFIFRVIYDSHWIDFLRKNWFEALLIAFVIFCGIINYILNFRITYYYFELLGFSNPELSNQHFLSIYMLLMIGLDLTRITTHLSEISYKPATTFLLSFVLLILMGAGLLMLPTMTPGKTSLDLIDAIFTSTSASCVTGLIVVDTATAFTLKGQIVILVLIQLGGIGMVSFATFFASFLTQGVGIKHQSIIQDYLSSESLVSATKLLRKVVLITLFIELLGTIGIYYAWDEELWEQSQQFEDVGQKIFFSFFHSVSAFCNGGFSLFSGGMADTNYKIDRMYNLHFIIVWIVVLGGLGYTTIEDIFSFRSIKERFVKPWKQWNVVTKINVYTTMTLLVIGTIGFLLLEIEKLTDRTIIQAFVTALFQSMTTRTAGFNTMDFEALNPATIMMCLVLMFIGASSGSTAGGIKITTFVLVFVAAVASIRRQERIVIANRTIPDELIRKAFAIFIFAIAYNILAIFLLLLVQEPSSPNDTKFILKIIFEQVSAFATVGISMNLTGELSFWGKVIIIMSMYLGRVGTLTLALALSNAVVTNSYRYPNAHVMVG